MAPVLAAAGVMLFADAAAAITIIDEDSRDFVREITRTVRAEYRKGDDVVEARSETSVADLGAGAPATILDVRLDTELTDTLDVAPLPSGPGIARAAINATGNSIVEVNAQLNDTITDALHILHAEVSETTTGSGGSGGPLRLLHSFVLRDMAFELWDHFGAAESPDPFVSASDSIGMRMANEVKRDGETAYKAGAIRHGGRDTIYYGVNLADGVGGVDSTGGSVSPSLLLPVLDVIGGSGDVPRTSPLADRFVPDLDLGLVDPFDFFEVTATMSATVILPPLALGAGARVRVGDPNRLSSDGLGSLSLQPATTVPAPATA